MRKACPKCGKRVEKSQHICPNCGNLLVSLSSGPIMPVEASHAEQNLPEQPGGTHPSLGRVSTKIELMESSAAVWLKGVRSSSHPAYGWGRIRVLNITQRNQSAEVTLKSLRYGDRTSGSIVEAVLELGDVEPSLSGVLRVEGDLLTSQRQWEEWNSGMFQWVLCFDHFDIDSFSQIEVTVDLDGISTIYAFEVPAR